jgi:hypothetical protein
MKDDFTNLKDQRNQAEIMPPHSSDVPPGIVKTVATSRRISLLRMLILPLVLALALILFLMVGRDQLVKNEFMNGLHELNHQIMEFKSKQNKLPNSQQFQDFTIKARLNIQGVHYDEKKILEDSPPETILAYTNHINLRFLPDGLAALSLGGDVEWINQNELMRRLETREKYYNSKILQQPK